MDKDIDYKTLLDFAASEIRSIIKIVQPESLCFYLLTDTLKHIDFMLQLIKENPDV